MKKPLPPSEWVLVFSLLAIMASLLTIAKVNTFRAASAVALFESEKGEVLVTISGAVAKPGEYLIVVGATLDEVLRKARPKPWANLQNISLNQVVEKPLSLVIEELSEVTVTVKGAVLESGKITVPAKARICDLATKVSLSPDADKAFFRRRRVLKNGEVIEVPKKTVEVNSVN